MTDQKEKKGLGCFGIGCLVIIILGVIIIAVSGGGYYMFTRSVRQYTADHGDTILVESSTQQEYDALVKRMNEFKNADPGGELTLTLTARDLNILIAHAPQWEAIRGKIRVAIGDGQISLTGSIPLSSIPNLRDQYLNGSLRFTPSIESKVFRARIEDVSVKDHDLPAKTRQSVAASLEQNLNNRLLGDPVIGTVFIKAETLKVVNDALVLTSAK